MKKIDYGDGTVGMTYETLSEVLDDKDKIAFFKEYEGFYYVKMNPTCFYDNGMLKINKKNGKVSSLLFTQYLCSEAFGKAKPVDINELRQRV